MNKYSFMRIVYRRDFSHGPGERAKGLGRSRTARACRQEAGTGRRAGGVGAGAAGLRGIDADLSAAGELAPTVAALALLASANGHASRLTGIAHLRGHETDRLAALVAEITRVGGVARQTDDGLVIDALPAGGRLRPALMRSYDDHRMAAFAALVGLGVPGTELDDIACTSKTLPDFPALWASMLDQEPGRAERDGGVR